MSDGWILKALLYNVLPMLLWKMIYGRLLCKSKQRDGGVFHFIEIENRIRKSIRKNKLKRLQEYSCSYEEQF